MPKKLNDTQIAELIMKHANGTSISTLAKEYEKDRGTIRRYLSNAPEMHQKCTKIIEETITEWFQEQAKEVKKIMKTCFELIPDKSKEASARDLAAICRIMLEMLQTFTNAENSNNDNLEIKDEITIEIVDNSGDDADG